MVDARRLPQLRLLARLWLAFSLPLIAYGLLFARTWEGGWAEILGAVAQLFLACSLGALPWRQRWVVGALLVLLLGLLAVGGLERQYSKYSWQQTDKAGLFESIRSANEVSGYGFRQYHAADAEAVTAKMKVRLLRGEPGWDWYRSDKRYELRRYFQGRRAFTRIAVPITPVKKARPYLMRTFDFREPLGGRIFRFLVDVRVAPEHTRSGHIAKLRPTFVQGRAALAGACDGLVLQTWGQGGWGRCLPFEPAATWQRYSLTWKVPQGVKSQVVRVMLSGFAGKALDVRRATLVGADRPLSPLMPQGAALQLAWGPVEKQSGKSFMPERSWQDFQVRTAKGRGDLITATLSTAPGVTLETRNLRVIDERGRPLKPAVSSNRQTIIFGDPNLAGHSLTTMSLALAALTPAPLSWVAMLLGLLGLVLTGSRAALVGAFVGMLWLFRLSLPKGWRRRGFLAALSLGLLAAVVFWKDVLALRLFSLSETTSRSEIWHVALEALKQHPWRGLGPGQFATFWQQLYPEKLEVAQHAHNWWLSFAVSYGSFGLLASLLCSLFLLRYAYSQGGQRALALVVGVLVMNVIDTTFFFSAVLFTLFIALAALGGDDKHLTKAHNKETPPYAVPTDPHNPTLALTKDPS